MKLSNRGGNRRNADEKRGVKIIMKMAAAAWRHINNGEGGMAAKRRQQWHRKRNGSGNINGESMAKKRENKAKNNNGICTWGK
jgi:hypothetical protein